MQDTPYEKFYEVKNSQGTVVGIAGCWPLADNEPIPEGSDGFKYDLFTANGDDTFNSALGLAEATGARLNPITRETFNVMGAEFVKLAEERQKMAALQQPVASQGAALGQIEQPAQAANKEAA